MALLIIHLGLAVTLIIFHSVFLFRGIAMLKNGTSPRMIDRISKHVSQLFYPLVLATGFLLAGQKGISSFYGYLHLSFAILPFIAIIIFTPFRKFKRKVPWLLPSINLVFFVCAGITGFIFSFMQSQV